MAVAITLEQDEALVLLELVTSEKLEGSVDVAERNALWALEGRLEEQLVEPFSSEYPRLLEEARQSLIERFGS